jgi:hypothetical protein
MTEERLGGRRRQNAAMSTTVVAAAESISEPWDALRRHLEARFRQCCDELRHYPSPIARCDDQLPKLIEQRDHARAELERMTAVAATATGATAKVAQRFLAAATPTDDDMEIMLRSRVKAAASHG